MTRSVNKVILIGNVTHDPEIRETQTGQKVATLGLATNREWITSDGRRKQSSQYHNLVCWARLADICEKFVRRGKLLYVEGYLKTRTWDTPEGIRKFKTEVVVEDLIMLEKRKGGGSSMEHNDDYSNDNEMMESEGSGDNTSDDSHTGDDSAATDDSTAQDDTTSGDDQSQEEEQKAPASSIIDADLGL